MVILNIAEYYQSIYAQNQYGSFWREINFKNSFSLLQVFLTNFIQWMPWIATKCLVPNVIIFVKLASNSGHLLITDKFLRPAGVRYSEVSLSFLKQSVFRTPNNIYDGTFYQESVNIFAKSSITYVRQDPNYSSIKDLIKIMRGTKRKFENFGSQYMDGFRDSILVRKMRDCC